MANPAQTAQDGQGAATAFLYLNREGRWPGFHWDGLELDAAGTLRLGALPAAPAPVTGAGAPADGPAGVAATPDGSVYYSVPGEGRIYRVDGCDGSAAPVPCAGAGAPGGLRRPRGLWWAPRRGALLVADDGAGQVDVLEAGSLRVLERWAGAGSQGPAVPWAIAGDGRGGFYLADHGTRTVQKLDRLGQPVPSFWQNAAGAVQEPTGVAAVAGDAGTRVYVLDAARAAVVVLDGDGHPVLDAGGAPLTLGAGVLQAPMGLAAGGGAVYVGDNQLLRVLVLDPAAAGRPVAEAVGYHGPVAALALDGAGHLLVHGGGSAPPVALTLGLGRRARGVLWSDPLQARNLPVHWRRLELLPGTLAPRAHLQLFLFTGNDPGAGPAAPDPAAPAPFGDGRWRPAPPDVEDLFVGGKAAGYLWIGALLSGDGSATPELAQVRIDYDQQSYLPFLPRLYRQHPPGDHFLLRWLSLFESFYAEVEAETARLPALFDPAAAPAGALAWLASGLAIPWDERWSEAQARGIIARAFERSGWRGTAMGLRQALKDLAGVDAIVEEPLLHMAWWALPANGAPACACGGAGAAGGSCGCGGAGATGGSCGCGGAGAAGGSCGCGGAGAAGGSCGCGGVGAGAAGPLLGAADSVLGYTTMLASAQPQGAVVGTTATLDRSHLVEGDDLGGPLFEDVAHRFSVLVQRGQVPDEAALARVRAVIEAEKPAHADYQLCVVEASLRVGFQARVGVDTVVAGQGAALRLGEAAPAGRAARLGGALPGQVGRSRVGESTRMG